MPGRGARAAPVVVVAALVVGGVQVTGEQAPGAQRLTGMAVLLGAALALWWRDRAPVPVLGATAAAAAAYYLVGCPPGPEPVPFVVALYAAAHAGYRRIAIGAVPAATLVVALVDRLAAQRTGLPAETGDLIAVAAVLVAAVGLGELARARDGERRATREQAAAEERLRIARELHDTMAHQLTAIRIQAAGALRRRETRPELAYPTLETIRRVAGEALTDIREVLGVLRAPSSRPGTDHGLARLHSLAEEAGVSAVVSTVGEPSPLPAAVELTAYRVVQEALTNVARHAAPSDAEVRLTYGRHDLIVEVLDHGRGADPNANSGGYGLVGMRERVGALGGELTAGARPGGGFVVRARLPLEPAPVRTA